MDINTKQRPVPTELLLDIKRLAETETSQEAFFRDVFDLFQNTPTSAIYGLLSPSEKQSGKISRVTFNSALRAIWGAFGGVEPSEAYLILSAYLSACMAGLRSRQSAKTITNPTFFKTILLLFPTIAERVADRHGRKFTTDHFGEILGPFFERVKKSDLERPPASVKDLMENLRKSLRTGFSIGSSPN
jgi:hypothetical protein